MPQNTFWGLSPKTEYGKKWYNSNGKFADVNSYWHMYKKRGAQDDPPPSLKGRLIKHRFNKLESFHFVNSNFNALSQQAKCKWSLIITFFIPSFKAKLGLISYKYTFFFIKLHFLTKAGLGITLGLERFTPNKGNIIILTYKNSHPLYSLRPSVTGKEKRRPRPTKKDFHASVWRATKFQPHMTTSYKLLTPPAILCRKRNVNQVDDLLRSLFGSVLVFHY